MFNRKNKGYVFVAEKAVTPLRDNDGKITHFISNDRDITEQRRLQDQLQQAHKMDAIGRLAGGVAHDFNNLLMVISSYAELMLDSLAPQHPLRRNVDEIQKASRRRRLDAATVGLRTQADADPANARFELDHRGNQQDAASPEKVSTLSLYRGKNWEKSRRIRCRSSRYL
jgi:signal transduction histidine kinase